MVYLLDTNVFIQAKNLYYSFDFCPAFWDWIDASNRKQIVFSVEKVRDEVLEGADELADWARERSKNLFLPSDNLVSHSLQETSRWAVSQGYESAAVNTFLQVADYHLVAHAHAHGCIVVTHERLDNSLKKIKIPKACSGLAVKCISPYDMLRKEEAKFVLGPQSQVGPQSTLI